LTEQPRVFVRMETLTVIRKERGRIISIEEEPAPYKQSARERSPCPSIPTETASEPAPDDLLLRPDPKSMLR
jgi:hypothetical protein